MTVKNASFQQLAARRRREAITGYLLVAPPTLLIFGLFFLPALQSIVRTLTNVESAPGQISIARYSDFLQNPISLSNLRFTFFVTLTAIALLFAICFPLA